jgi:hypothetical protein
MATARRKTLANLTDQELGELLDLVKGADTVELKLTVPEADQRATVQGLALDPLEAQIRQVFFFDTPDLQLNKAGVVARARRVQGRAADSVVKLRPVVPETLPEDARRSGSLGVEVDAMPGGWVCSASMKGRTDNEEVKLAVAGKRAVRKLFSKEQRAFYAAHAPAGLDFDDLSVMGPIFVLKLNYRPVGYDRKLVAEVWLYPDGARILELSTKCAPSEMFDVAMKSRAFLAKQGVNISGEQQTKTKTALQFFSKQLKAA